LALQRQISYAASLKNNMLKQMKCIPDAIYQLDNYAFVEAAYRLVLERDPDTAGATAYLQRMHEGLSKEEVLLALHQSEERRQKRLPSLSGIRRLKARVFLAKSSPPKWQLAQPLHLTAVASTTGDDQRGNTERVPDAAFLQSLLPDRVGEAYTRLPPGEFHSRRDAFRSFSDILKTLQLIESVLDQAGQSPPEQEDVLKKAAGQKLFSFDLWDTILRRTCHPDAVKLSSARHLLVEYYNELLPAFRSLPALMHARLLAEKREGHSHRGEYLYSKVAGLFVDSVVEHGTPLKRRANMRDSLMEYELKVEKACTFLDPWCSALINETRHVPKVVTSDFYHDSRFLRELLKHHQLEGEFAKIYASSEHRQSKREGGLFDLVLDSFKLPVSEVIHLGDHPHSDVDVPQSKGIVAVHYENTTFAAWQKAHEVVLSETASTENPRVDRVALWKSYSLASNPLSKVREKKVDDIDSARLGRLLAPMAAGYALFIIEQAKRSGVDKIFFFTREGIFLRKVYEAVTANDPYFSTYPASSLLEVSRMATFAASLSAFDIAEFMRVWNMYSTQSPAAFMATLGVSAEEGRELFKASGLKYESPVVYPWKHTAFVKFIESKKFQRFVREHCGRRKKNLLAYLRSQDFPLTANSSAFTVDIGWRGTIQDNIAHATPSFVHGIYLALFRYLNKQPSNTAKAAYLFDLNSDVDRLEPRDITPMEMLFNSPGGSVTGYTDDSHGEIIVHKKVEPSEEEVHAASMRALQDGILEALPHVIAHVRENALTAETLRPTALNLMETLLADPPEVFARAYFRLNHNEVFGTGATADKSSGTIRRAPRTSSRANETPSAVRAREAILQRIYECRWPEGLLRVADFRSSMNELPLAEQLQLPPVAFDSLHGATPHGKVAFFIPPAIRGSGGIRTMCNFARGLADYGHEIFMYLEREGDGISVIRDMLGDVPAHVQVGWVNFLPFDCAIATLAHSAPFVAALPHATHKFYFVQDFEAGFNPLSDGYVIGENSYTYGLTHLTIGRWLSHLIPSQYGQAAFPAGLGVDTAVYRPLGFSVRKPAIAFLYQPDKFRRAPELGIQALSLVKQRHPETTIYLYGHDHKIHLDFETEQLGLLSDLNEINTLYNKCHIGLCISLSNPSRIPFEMMASGCVPVDVYRYNNLFDYPEVTVLLAHQTPEALAKAICSLIESPHSLQKRRSDCISFASSRSLQWEVDTLVNTVHARMKGLLCSSTPSTPIYHGCPILADGARGESGSWEFCASQAAQAGIAPDWKKHLPEKPELSTLEP
jgi:FMN phosphatase YigB (HAD superfamily)